MFDRLTDRSRTVLHLARKCAESYSCSYIGTEHLLAGLVREKLGVAASSLQRLGVTSENLEVVLDKIMGDSPKMIHKNQLPFSPRAKVVLDKASKVARKLSHNYIGTEHLLLGIVAEPDGACAEALKFLGITPESVAVEVRETLGATMEPSTTSQPDDPKRETLVELEAHHSFDLYQEWTRNTAIYPGACKGTEESLIYCLLKLGGEAGEIQEKVGKLIRGNGFKALVGLSDETVNELAKEAGDVVWYLARLTDELGLKLSDVVAANIAKLTSRKTRGVLHGSGDNR